MGRLSLLAWRSVASRRARSLLTIAGIALGVGVLFAAMATNAGIDSSIDTTVHQMLGRTDMRVAAFGETGLGPDSLKAIAGTPGVGVVAPQLEERTLLQLAPGASQTGYSDAVTVLGIDPVADARLHDLPLSAGQPLGAGPARAALITERLASATGLRVGSQVTLLGSADAGPLVFDVAGVVSGAGPFVATDGRTIITSIAAAQQLFSTDRVTRADVGLAPGASADAVIAARERRLTFEPYTASGPADIASSLRSSAVDFRSLTALIAAISLFVGAFLIFNTLSMTVVERVRDVGLLRAAGTTARQVNVFILQQALVLGIAGSVLGLALGIVLAAAVVRYVQAVDAIPLDGLDVPLGGVVLALVVGIAVTLAAALEPAYRAGRITPVEALKARVDPAAGLRARLRWLVVVFVVVAVAGLLLWPVGAGLDQLARSLLVFAILLAGTLATPFLLGPLGRIAGLPFAAILPAEERLTRGALVRDRSRTVLTVGALTIGLAMIVAVGGLAQNAHRSASDWLADVVPGDEIVTAIRPVPLDEGLQGELATVDGVSRVTPVATFEVAWQGVRLDAAAISGADFLADGRLTFESGDRRAALEGLDAGGSVVLPAAMADRLGLRVGDRLAVLGASGKLIDLRVSGTVEHGLPGSGGETLFVGWSDATNRLGVAGADFFAVRFAGGRADARPALETAARQLALQPNSIDRVEGAISSALGSVFGLFDGLGIVAVLMAGLGIVNTLSMNVLERVREIGVLRATGMTRRQVARMVLVEAGILGLVGALIGSVTGVAAAFVIVGLPVGRDLAAFEIPWATIVLAAAFGVVVAVLASYQPARMASRVSIVRAVQFE